MSGTATVRRIGLVAKPGSREAIVTTREVVDWLHRRGCEVVVDHATAAALPPGDRKSVV